MTQTALYRHFDDAGRLLYVGIAGDPMRRLRTHARRAEWKGKVVRQTIEWLPDRKTALAAETKAIKSEHPKLNVMHRVKRKQRKAPPAPIVADTDDMRAYRAAMDGLLHPERAGRPTTPVPAPEAAR